ncbi:hypothetical protein KC19_3G189100 [Ceratodon purpureus]|uniref:Secreted protein n=1 Tax=Ceratodon purpureus TaxID=3225 RepID=A0A8T0IMS0_CERPU|nr:hypothetical protein KC19_3G189100 [Ceratodon purpureus]
MNRSILHIFIFRSCPLLLFWGKKLASRAYPRQQRSILVERCRAAYSVGENLSLDDLEISEIEWFNPPRRGSSANVQ